MCRSRTAATADDGDAVLLNEASLERSQLLGRQVVDRVAADVPRQASVRHDHDGARRVLTEVTNRLLHQVRARRAVEADNIDRQRLERRQRGRNVTTDQHRAGRFDRNRAEDRHLLAEFGHCIARRNHSQLHLQDVLTSLDI